MRVMQDKPQELAEPCRAGYQHSQRIRQPRYGGGEQQRGERGCFTLA